MKIYKPLTIFLFNLHLILSYVVLKNKDYYYLIALSGILICLNILFYCFFEKYRNAVFKNVNFQFRILGFNFHFLYKACIFSKNILYRLNWNRKTFGISFRTEKIVDKFTKTTQVSENNTKTEITLCRSFGIGIHLFYIEFYLDIDRSKLK